MSNVKELLNQRRLECLELIKSLRVEIDEIGKVTAMLDGTVVTDAVKKAPATRKRSNLGRGKTKMLIISAIKSGCGKPVEIVNHIKKRFNQDVLTSTISTALTGLKKSGDIHRDKHDRWVLTNAEPGTMSETMENIMDDGDLPPKPVDTEPAVAERRF